MWWLWSVSPFSQMLQTKEWFDIVETYFQSDIEPKLKKKKEGKKSTCVINRLYSETSGYIVYLPHSPRSTPVQTFKISQLHIHINNYRMQGEKRAEKHIHIKLHISKCVRSPSFK